LFYGTAKSYEEIGKLSDIDLNKLLFPDVEEIPLKRKVLAGQLIILQRSKIPNRDQV